MEGVHEAAAIAFQAEGFHVVQHAKLKKEEFEEELASTHIIGIRSKTVLSAEVLAKVTLMPSHALLCAPSVTVFQ